ncbi:hypothetical protein [Vibrio parahaemolyticus]|uniref:hypothetical protein n=1 Tax=Vibrio parahaemolyticus TaxID=670 RepID=UPI000813883D|nr:hypothetical protein [Vibrio parahaemolyticus]OCP68328.1 hypothetical protein AKH08_16060 [Vibrio parahaemolyticus]
MIEEVVNQFHETEYLDDFVNATSSTLDSITAVIVWQSLKVKWLNEQDNEKPGYVQAWKEGMAGYAAEALNPYPSHYDTAGVTVECIEHNAWVLGFENAKQLSKYNM